MKLDLLTNATVVNDAMKFVSEHSNNNNTKNLSYRKDSQGSKEPDYDEDKDQLEEQEEQTGEITTNYIF